MADTPSKKGNAPIQRLFIKVILPSQGTERRVPGGGSPPKPFRPVNVEFRKSLSLRIKTIDKHIGTIAKSLSAVPVRVKLLSEASAKSHRPDVLFSNSTCPIIGAGRLGEIYIKATHSGLNKINQIILDNTSDQMIKAISTIENIDVLNSADRLSGLDAESVLRKSPKANGGYLLKIQLFDLKDDGEQKRLMRDFDAHCQKEKIKIEKSGYSEKSLFYAATCKNIDDVKALSNIIGVRSVKSMPIVENVRSHNANTGTLPRNLPSPDDNPQSHPTVAVVDSGITNSIPALNRWIVGRESTVATQYRNTQHGTFVAGLLCWANELNPQINEIDSIPCNIFDLQVLPNGDPSHGDIDEVTETQLLQDLESSLSVRANDIKVWNLSLGTNEVCSLDNFSSFAVELDKLQEKYNVSFIISAGNYSEAPLLNYPRTDPEKAKGRITTPADSVLGITVGSVAHIASAVRGPKKGEPSPFSRHGAGPNHIIKPDLVHYGGTCSVDGAGQHGIRSILGAGTGELMGTSFSTPLISRLMANIYHQVTPSPSPTLARALLTHHSTDPRTGGRVPDTEENYLGFGLPRSLKDCLECNPWSSTLVFEDELRPGYFLEWDNFPYPNSLIKNGKYLGDIWMTVAFSPSLNESWGTEYCETHIDAHFGVYRPKKDKKGQIKDTFEGLVPPEHKNPGVLYESYQIEKLRKWAPVRTYFGSLGRGVSGNRWRLKVQLLSRHGIDKNFRPQKFALIVTIADPTKRGRVYDEMAVNILNRFQAQNLSLRATTRIQTRNPD